MAAQSMVLQTLAVLGAIAQFAIGIRLYEPPGEYAEGSSSAMEATVFLVAFLLLYVAIGFGLAALEGLAPPLGRVAVLLVATVGLYSFYTTVVGGRGEGQREATRAMGAAAGITIAALGVVVLLL